MMGFLRSLGQMFAPHTRGPKNEEFSPEARDFIKNLALQLGDTEIIEWVAKNPVFVYDDYCALGYVWPPQGETKPRIGLRRDVLARSKTAWAEFVGGHELGHIRQYLHGAQEPPKFSLALFLLELDASAFGRRAVSSRWSRYRFRHYHYVLAAESAFPGWSQLVGTCLLVGITFGVGRLLTWCSTKIPVINRVYEYIANLIDKMRKYLHPSDI